MSQSLTKSWHIPRPLFDIEPRQNADIGIPLVFLRRLDEKSRATIQARVENYDREYSKQLTVRFDTRFEVSRIVPHAYIRDGTFDENAVHIFIRRLQGRTPGCRSAIFIDEAADSGSCIVSTWQWPPEEEPDFTIASARIQQALARPLLSLIMSGTAGSLIEAIGDDYADVKVDFANNFTPKDLDPHLPAFEPPSFWSQDLTLCSQEKITILSLVSLTDAELHTIKQSITSPFAQIEVEVEIIEWKGGSLSRGDIYQIFQWLEANKKSAKVLGFAFFIDYLFQDDEGRAQLLAASRTSAHGHYPGDNLLDLLPVKPGRLKDLWYTALHAGEAGDSLIPGEKDHEVEQRCRENVMKQKTADTKALTRSTNLRLEEMVYNPGKAFSTGIFSSPTVWYLQDFSLEEQRKIRALLSVDQYDDNRETDHDYMYMGYVFPDEGSSTTHKIDDLLQLFQECDPYSPDFKPDYASIRFNEYPAHFIAVDQRIFDEDYPCVLVASRVDFYYDGHELGWIAGTIAPDLAHNAMDNLEIANMGPTELMKDAEHMWLNDMKYFRPIYELEKQAEKPIFQSMAAKKGE